MSQNWLHFIVARREMIKRKVLNQVLKPHNKDLNSLITSRIKPHKTKLMSLNFRSKKRINYKKK